MRCRGACISVNAIQQEWETWVANGWVDTINPMTYVTSAKELAINAGSVRESTADRALVYPGLSIRQLDTAGLIEQLDSSRECGTLGTTMFRSGASRRQENQRSPRGDSQAGDNR